MAPAPTVASIHQRLLALGRPARAAMNQRYFKTGPGEYAEGDRFMGVDVPTLRKLAREYQDLALSVVGKLLTSVWHEERALSVLVMVRQYQRGDTAHRKKIYAMYIANTRYINNWDLVDASAEHIVGPHVSAGSRAVLARLARSTSLWERRIAMLSTFHYIRKNEFADAIRIAEMLLGDQEDLIHKAVGWMLREIANRDQMVTESFLRSHAGRIPRTTLRYAIERFPAELRAKLMQRPGPPTRRAPARSRPLRPFPPE